MRKLILALSVALLPSVNLGLAGIAFADSPSGSGDAIVQTALRYVGYPYTTVGNSPATGFSCIGFVSYVYGVNGIPLPDDLGGAMGYAPGVAFSDLQPGDVLYFQNTVWPGLSHTAIYLGGGRFVHAEWYNRGVVISSFSNDPVDGNYWTEHYLGANRPWSAAGAGVAVPAAPAPATSVSTSRTTVVSSAPSPPKPRLWDGPRANVQVAALNVRLRPSVLAPIQRLATQGTTVVVLKQYQSWDWVQLPNASFGWVIGTAIGVKGESPLGEQVSTQKESAPTGNAAAGLAPGPLPLTTPSVDGLRVHLRPSLAAPVVAATSRGQRVLILKRWLGWLRILLPDGSRGWVDGAYITSASVQQAASSRAVSDHSGGSAHVGGPALTATVRVHSRPGLQAPVLRLAAAGTRVRVLGSSGMWARVLFPSGRSGWVYRAYVKQSGE